MQQSLFILLAIIAGVVLPIQAGFNTELGKAVKSPVYATLLSFIVGMVGLFLYCVFAKVPLGTVKQGLQMPWYYWTGGLLGAFYVFSIIVLTPRLGVTLAFGLTIAGQMVFSLIMDHYGWLGVPEAPINWARSLGVALIIAGVVLIRAN
jgi:transporter family-2 protein